MGYTCTYELVSHPGLKRDGNEDQCSALQIFKSDINGNQKKVTLAIVADGMGGAIAGEIASNKAVESIIDEFNQMLIIPKINDVESTLKNWIENAHNQIASLALNDADVSGLGTTIVILLIIDGRAHISWVGDSRVYLFNDNGTKKDKLTNDLKLSLLTNDHSLIWNQVKKGLVKLDDVESLENSHIITQSLGSIQNTPKPEYLQQKLNSGDKLLMCTDGVNLHLSTEKIKSILSRMDHYGIEGSIKYLESQVLDAGAEDNFTAILLDYVAGATMINRMSKTRSFWWSSRKEIGWGFLLCLGLIAFTNWIGFHEKVKEEKAIPLEAKKEVINRDPYLLEYENMQLLASKQLSNLLSIYTEDEAYNKLTQEYVRFVNDKDKVFTQIKNDNIDLDQLLNKKKIQYDTLDKHYKYHIQKHNVNE